MNSRTLGCAGRHAGGSSQPPRALRAHAADSAIIEKSGWTQAEAAERCNVTQPRINDLLRGRISRFSLDALVNIAAGLGRKITLKLDAS